MLVCIIVDSESSGDYVMMSAKAFLLSLILSFLFVGTASADFYSFTDENGVVHVTNVPTSRNYRWMMSEKNSFRRSLKTYNRKGFEEMIEAAAQRHGVDPSLAKAVVKAESDYNANAVSVDGAKGLMQLMPETARLAGVKDIHDPVENVEGGMRHLSRLIKMFATDVRLAIAAYNAGEKAVLKYAGIPPYAETREYVRRVMHYQKIYKAQAARRG
ncbi:MAG: lytic transglycosylase domain-containing protein [Deltaproteobacteria bacterium]